MSLAKGGVASREGFPQWRRGLPVTAEKATSNDRRLAWAMVEKSGDLKQAGRFKPLISHKKVGGKVIYQRFEKMGLFQTVDFSHCEGEERRPRAEMRGPGTRRAFRPCTQRYASAAKSQKMPKSSLPSSQPRCVGLSVPLSHAASFRSTARSQAAESSFAGTTRTARASSSGPIP